MIEYHQFRGNGHCPLAAERRLAEIRPVIERIRQTPRRLWNKEQKAAYARLRKESNYLRNCVGKWHVLKSCKGPALEAA